MSDSEDVGRGTSELKDLEFKLFHNLSDLQVNNLRIYKLHVHFIYHFMSAIGMMHTLVHYVCVCSVVGGIRSKTEFLS